MIDASSPRKAFVPALNFGGGGGASSSELSPMENFHDEGRADPLTAGFATCAAPRFRLGLEACVLICCRDMCLPGMSL